MVVQPLARYNRCCLSVIWSLALAGFDAFGMLFTASHHRSCCLVSSNSCPRHLRRSSMQPSASQHGICVYRLSGWIQKIPCSFCTPQAAQATLRACCTPQVGFLLDLVTHAQKRCGSGAITSVTAVTAGTAVTRVSDTPLATAMPGNILTKQLTDLLHCFLGLLAV